MLKFKSKLSVEQSMIFESCFKPSLRFDLEDKKELISKCRCSYLYVDGKLAGEFYGLKVEDLLEPVKGVNKFSKANREISLIYLYSGAILPKFQGKGYAKKLYGHFIKTLKGKADYAIGHARDGASWAIMKSLGAEEIRVYKNWYGTKENYHFFKIKI